MKADVGKASFTSFDSIEEPHDWPDVFILKSFEGNPGEVQKFLSDHFSNKKLKCFYGILAQFNDSTVNL